LTQELTLEEIVREYPPLTEENVRVAATLAKEEELLPLWSRSATPWSGWC